MLDDEFTPWGGKNTFPLLQSCSLVKHLTDPWGTCMKSLRKELNSKLDIMDLSFPVCVGGGDRCTLCSGQRPAGSLQGELLVCGSKPVYVVFIQCIYSFVLPGCSCDIKNVFTWRRITKKGGNIQRVELDYKIKQLHLPMSVSIFSPHSILCYNFTVHHFIFRSIWN